MPRLILNADDLGYTPGVNRAIVELAGAGALTSATLMANGGAFSDAAQRLSSPPRKFRAGCHVVLVDGVPCSPAAEVPSLLAPARGEPKFRPTLGSFVRDLLLGRISDGDLEREIVAQIRTVQRAGFAISHVDTHKHTHMFPRVLRPLLRAAALCGVRAVRNPFEPSWSRAATLRAGARVSLSRRLQVAVLARSERQFRREVSRAGLLTTDGALGVLATGVLDASVLQALLCAAEQHAGTWELVCHPGYVDEQLGQAATRLRQEREVEREAFLQAAESAPGLERISFAELGSE